MIESCLDRQQGGFTYIGLMILVVLLGIGLALTGQVWHTSVTRERERELLFVGGQFRNAIEAFHARNRGVGDGYPRSFDELLLDPHLPGVRRYLRKIYPDPLTGNREWGVIKSRGGGIVGVYSLEKGTPFKQSGFPARYKSFAGSGSYAEWTFVAADSGGDKVAAVPAADNPSVAPTSPVPATSPGVAAANPPADVPDREPGQDPSCAWVAANDQRLCNQEKMKWRDDAVACFASIGLRAAYCATGVRPPDLPALAIRYGSGRVN